MDKQQFKELKELIKKEGDLNRKELAKFNDHNNGGCGLVVIGTMLYIIMMRLLTG